MRCRAGEVLIEGPAGTGKSLACLLKCVMVCERYSKCRVLIARATRVSMTESVLVTLERELLPEGHPARIGSDVTRAGRRSYSFPNGSELVVRGLDNSESVMSSEYDLIYVAESTEIILEDWERLLTRLRNHKVPYQQAIADCNPGAPGHWLNQRALRGKMTRLLSRHSDNPSVTEDYLAKLSGLTGYRRVRLFDGRWSAAEGVVFPELDEQIHKLPAFDVPDYWPWYVGWDPGFAHPTAIPWLVVAPNGDIIMRDEIYGGGKSIAQHSETVMQRLPGRNVRRWYGDPHEFFSNRAQGDSCAIQAKKAGLPMFVGWANQQKQAMVNSLRQLLINTVTYKTTGKRIGPCFFITDNCVSGIAEFQTWSFKKNSQGELLAGDDAYVDADNHIMDCLCGMVSTSGIKWVDGAGKGIEIASSR